MAGAGPDLMAKVEAKAKTQALGTSDGEDLTWGKSNSIKPLSTKSKQVQPEDQTGERRPRNLTLPLYIRHSRRVAHCQCV